MLAHGGEGKQGGVVMTSNGMQVWFTQGLRAAVGAVALMGLLAGCRGECKLDADCDQAQVCSEFGVCQSVQAYGLNGRAVYSLGTWPSLAQGEKVFDVPAPEHRALGEYELSTSGYLVSTGTHLAAGYTLLGSDDLTGRVALHALDGGTTEYVAANANYSAAAVGDTVLVNGFSLGDKAQGEAIYALKPGAAASVAAVPGLPADAGQVYSGPTVVTAEGVGAFGYYVGGRNVLRAVGPAQLSEALESDTPVDLSTAPEVYAGTDLQGAARAGNGVALLRGAWQPDGMMLYTDVAYVPLTAPADRGTGAPTVGTLATAIRFQDGCTELVSLGNLGDDLLVGVEDKAGRRLVRVRVGTGASGEDQGSRAEADCATVVHDPALGTLKLKPGFSVVETTALPAGVSDVAFAPVED